MDPFIKSPPEAQSFALSAFDMQGSFANIPYAFFYGNTNNAKDFMPSELLKESLGKALEAFPILLGHVKSQARGKLHIVVEPENLNVPEFLESQCDTISFADIKKTEFAWDSWPEGVATVGGFATPAASDGEIKLMNVHIVRLKNESGLVLFINIPHYAFDGAGYFTFMKHWASTMKAMCEGDLTGGKGLSEGLCHDRDVIRKYWPKGRKPIDPTSEAIYTVSNMFCDLLAWLSPTMLGRLLGKLGSLSSGEAHLFHISKETLEGLKASTKEHVPTGAHISSNDLLVALVSRTYIRNQPQPELKAGWFSGKPEPEAHFTVRIPCDCRPRLSIKENYTGNLLVPRLVREPIKHILQPTTPETLARSALEVRNTIGSVDAELVAKFHDVISEHPTSHMRPLSFAASHTTTSMVTTSQVRFGLYDADFGSGVPEFVCLTKLFAGSYSMAAFLPPPPSVDGVYVLFTSNAVAMKKILQDEYWSKTAKLLW